MLTGIPTRMAPALKPISLTARTITATASAALLHKRALSVNSTQKVTLGIIGLYVVVIALLWNIPYVRNVLWPFKVRHDAPNSRTPQR